VLKPGVHIDRGAITRHIGSQNANPKRFYSNPVPWMGPLRRNQLQYNMKLKFEIELQLSLTRDPDMLCRRPYLASPSSSTSTVAAAAAAVSCSSSSSPLPSSSLSIGATEYAKCPLKRSGAQQPVGLAFPSVFTTPLARGIVRGLTRMELGTLHDDGTTLQEAARHVLVTTHAANATVQVAGQWDAHNMTSGETVDTSVGKWAPPPWDAVVLLVAPHPVDTVLQWHASGGVTRLKASDHALDRQHFTIAFC
jgi:hypothetical protein